MLGLEETHPEWERHPAMMMRNGSGVALFDGTERRPGFLHVAFRVDRPSWIEAQSRLVARGIAFEIQDHGTAHSMYFADPDGVRLELTTYELE